MDVYFNGYMISDNKALLDKETIVAFLSRSYWANARPVEKTLQAIENSLCIGVYENQRQIGFARIVTDGVTVYYLCDVYIDEDYRGKGIGRKLIETIINREDLIELQGILGTKDAHGLYSKYGFIVDTERFMRRRPS